jgi:hypothetical protein
LVAVLPVVVLAAIFFRPHRSDSSAIHVSADKPKLRYSPKIWVDLSGYFATTGMLKPWPASASLTEIRDAWSKAGYRNIDLIDQQLRAESAHGEARINLLLSKVLFSHYEGEAQQAYEVLKQARAYAEANDRVAEACLYTLIYAQGVTALRLGENENCILCRGESSCILPIAPAAVHTKPYGSRTAITHFTEYLRQFPDDLEVRWLLNVAHMTLGEYPGGVDPAYRISLDRWYHSEFDIGKFRDIGPLVGVNRLNQAGGAVMDDFDNDGLLYFYLGTGEPNLATLIPNCMFKNVGGKRFAEITVSSGTGHLQKGHGVACGEWNRDGNLDLFMETGGAGNGDQYHNVLFQNPGQGNHWLTVKLAGKKTNRSAVGARIQVTTDADPPLTIHRHISSGSSFGGNPFQQTIGLAQAKRVTKLEVYWPSSETTQVFRDIAVDQTIEITEFATEYQKRNEKPIPVPK